MHKTSSLEANGLQQQKTGRIGHQSPLLSDKNQTLRLQIAKNYKNVASSDECTFLLRYSDGRTRILRKQHENMDSYCIASTDQATGGSVMESIGSN